MLARSSVRASLHHLVRQSGSKSALAHQLHPTVVVSVHKLLKETVADVRCTVRAVCFCLDSSSSPLSQRGPCVVACRSCDGMESLEDPTVLIACGVAGAVTIAYLLRSCRP